MKIRTGFVSNSSSSSFVVIGYDLPDLSNLKDIFAERALIVLGEDGQTEFGWQSEEYHDMWSRINFAYLQTRSVNNDEWLAMLESVIVEVFGDWQIDWVITDEYLYGEKANLKSSCGNKLVWGYIDHQSAACEGANTEMFDDRDTLKRFLFSNGSYIQGGNDNG